MLGLSRGADSLGQGGRLPFGSMRIYFQHSSETRRRGRRRRDLEPDIHHLSVAIRVERALGSPGRAFLGPNDDLAVEGSFATLSSASASLSFSGLPGSSPWLQSLGAGLAVPAWDEPGIACGRGSRASVPRRWRGSGERYL